MSLVPRSTIFTVSHKFIVEYLVHLKNPDYCNHGRKWSCRFIFIPTHFHNSIVIRPIAFVGRFLHMKLLQILALQPLIHCSNIVFAIHAFPLFHKVFPNHCSNVLQTQEIKKKELAFRKRTKLRKRPRKSQEIALLWALNWQKKTLIITP